MKWPWRPAKCSADEVAAAAQIDQPHFRPIADDDVGDRTA